MELLRVATCTLLIHQTPPLWQASHRSPIFISFTAHGLRCITCPKISSSERNKLATPNHENAAVAACVRNCRQKPNLRTGPCRVCKNLGKFLGGQGDRETRRVRRKWCGVEEEQVGHSLQIVQQRKE